MRAIKTAIIDVGGGMRAVYAAGVLDYCIENNITFDVGIGVSAGGGNLASLKSKQFGRSLRFYTKYIKRKKYMSWSNFFKTGNYINLEYAYNEIPNSKGEDPLDYDTYKANPMKHIIVSTNAITGEPHYFTDDDIKLDYYDPFKASSTIPVVCKPTKVGDNLYFDGAISDSVPVKKALEMGCDKIVVLLSRPYDYVGVPGKDPFYARFLKRSFPIINRKLLDRYKLYNTSLDFAKEVEKTGKLIIVAPNETFGVDTLTKNTEDMKKLYKLGMKDAKIIKEFLERE